MISIYKIVFIIWINLQCFKITLLTLKFNRIEENRRIKIFTVLDPTLNVSINFVE